MTTTEKECVLNINQIHLHERRELNILSCFHFFYHGLSFTVIVIVQYKGFSHSFIQTID